MTPTAGMAGAERRRQQRDRRQRGRDRADAQPAGEPVAHRAELAVQAVDVREDALRPVEHALALGCQALVALAASHDREADLVLEPADPGGERRLRHVAGRGGAAEVPLAGERDEIGRAADSTTDYDRAKLSKPRSCLLTSIAAGRTMTCVARPRRGCRHAEAQGTPDHAARARRETPCAPPRGTRRSTPSPPASPARVTSDASTSFGIFSCSKATNEMNFLAQKFARQVMGTNNIDSCNRT